MKYFKLFFVCVILSLLCSSTVAVAETIKLAPIVVTLSRIAQNPKYATQNISVVDLGSVNLNGHEVTEALEMLPSVSILEYGTVGSNRSIHVRGAASTQVLVLIDGRPVNTPRDGYSDFNKITLSNIERIEVLRGPASSIYGTSAVGGVINMITKTPTEQARTELQTKFGSFSTKLTSLTHGQKVKKFDYFLSYDYLSSHGHRDNSDYLSHNANLKVGYELSDDNHLSLSSGYYNSETGAPGLVTNIDLDDRQETLTRYIDLTYNGTMMEGQDLLLKLFHNYDELTFIESHDPLDALDHRTKIYGLDAQVSHVFFDIFRTALGASFQEHRLNSDNSGKHSYDLRGLYLESETDIFSKGIVKFGARWDDYSNFGDRVSPSASINVWPLESVKVHALMARSFRAPTFNDLYWPREDWGIWGGVEGNPNLTPEEAESYEAGISGYFFEGFRADVTFFKTDFEDLIEWTSDSVWWWRPSNVSSATIKGAELEIEYIFRELLKTNFNYTYLEARNKNTDTWLAYRPRHLYKLRLTYSALPQCDVSLSGIYKSRRYTNTANTDMLKHFFTVDLDASYEINENIQLVFEVKNIFDRAYQEQKDYSTPGRAFYGGVKITF